jgi:hypothetical protein
MSEWFRLLREGMEDAGSPKVGAELHDFATKALESRDDEEPYRFVHLVNARFVSGGTLVPTGDSIMWRGCIKDISGWSLGSFGSA